MDTFDAHISAIARGRRNLITRAEVLACDGTDDLIASRLERTLWQQLFPGVYLIGAAPPDWEQQLHAAVLAAGDGALASGRAALMLWGLDGIRSAPLELTVPHHHHPLPAGVVLHRTRRPPAPHLRAGIPVTSVERTVLDAAACLPRIVVVKAFESAYRRGYTSPGQTLAYLHRHGGRGVRGAGVLRSYLEEREPGRAAGSGAEVEMLDLLRSWGIEPPERQVVIDIGNGQRATVDMGWLPRRKLVEVDGFDGHAAPEDLEASDERQNHIFEAGYELRRYSARRIRRHPEEVARSVYRFLTAPSPFSPAFLLGGPARLRAG